jgi:hypothetical protein
VAVVILGLLVGPGLVDRFVQDAFASYIAGTWDCVGTTPDSRTTFTAEVDGDGWVLAEGRWEDLEYDEQDDFEMVALIERNGTEARLVSSTYSDPVELDDVALDTEQITYVPEYQTDDGEVDVQRDGDTVRFDWTSIDDGDGVDTGNELECTKQ